MARSLKEIEQEVRSLGDLERNQLLRALIADVDGDPEPGVRDAWLQEARKRYQELRSGLVTPIPAVDVVRAAAARLKNEH